MVTMVSMLCISTIVTVCMLAVGSVVWYLFQQCYSNNSNQCICGLFSVVDLVIFAAVASFSDSRMVSLGLSHNKLHCVCVCNEARCHPV